MMLTLLLAFLQPLVCQPIQSDVIKGSDLAAALPVLASIPGDLTLGLAPMPGQHRTFTVGELKRIAATQKIDPAPIMGDICFAWTLVVPSREQLLTAMQKTLTGRNPRIEIVEQSLTSAPPGEVVFPLSGLSASSGKPVIWRGYVRYAEKKQFPIWARATVSVQEKHLVSLVDLRAGDLLDARRLQVENYTGPIGREKYVTEAAQAEGMLLKRPLASGVALLEDMLEVPREVERGDVVNAIVLNGAARLDVQAIAEDSGRRGQIINVRNPRSGRVFRARVEEKGTVLVVPGGPFGLVPGDPAKS